MAETVKPPMPVITSSTPGDCFYVAYEACRIAVKYMTPVMVLTDGYLANGSEPWQIPKLSDLPEIKVKFANKSSKVDDQYMPYLREKNIGKAMGASRNYRPRASHRWTREGRCYWQCKL